MNLGTLRFPILQEPAKAVLCLSGRFSNSNQVLQTVMNATERRHVLRHDANALRIRTDFDTTPSRDFMHIHIVL